MGITALDAEQGECDEQRAYGTGMWCETFQRIWALNACDK